MTWCAGGVRRLGQTSHRSGTEIQSSAQRGHTLDFLTQSLLKPGDARRALGHPLDDRM